MLRSPSARDRGHPECATTTADSLSGMENREASATASANTGIAALRCAPVEMTAFGVGREQTLELKSVLKSLLPMKPFPPGLKPCAIAGFNVRAKVRTLQIEVF